MTKSKILDEVQIRQKLNRIAWQIYEANYKESSIIVAGIRGNGFVIAKRLTEIIKKISSIEIQLTEVRINKKDPLKTPTELSNENIDYTNQIKQWSESDKSDKLQKLCCQTFTYNPHQGEIVGQHNGAHFFTIGQRKGLGIGGKKEPLFVIETDVNNNIVYVGQGEHPGLFRKGLFIGHKDVHWVRPDLQIEINQSLRCEARIRYRQALQAVTIFHQLDGYYLIFDQLQRGISSGQFAAWYIHDELVGSGVIQK